MREIKLNSQNSVFITNDFPCEIKVVDIEILLILDSIRIRIDIYVHHISVNMEFPTLIFGLHFTVETNLQYS